jgi:hypothetical protein
MPCGVLCYSGIYTGRFGLPNLDMDDRLRPTVIIPRRRRQKFLAMVPPFLALVTLVASIMAMVHS